MVKQAGEHQSFPLCKNRRFEGISLLKRPCQSWNFDCFHLPVNRYSMRIYVRHKMLQKKLFFSQHKPTAFKRITCCPWLPWQIWEKKVTFWKWLMKEKKRHFCWILENSLEWEKCWWCKNKTLEFFLKKICDKNL